LTLRDGVSSTTRVIGSVLDVNVVPEDPGALLDAIAAPTTRIVTLTVTEKGYCHDPATRTLRLDHPDLAHDLAHPDAPKSAIGLLAHAWRDEAGHEHALDDPLADELAALHVRAMGRATANECAAEITRFSPVFGDLADEPRLVAALAHALEALQSHGVAAALARWDR
jgi:mannitol-1-phosphate/altronate dehydrogenase